MSGHVYINRDKLFDDDDVDDYTFINSGKNPPRYTTQAPPSSSYGGQLANLEQQRQAMLQRQREIEQRTLDSSARSIGILRDSEQIGIATAEELALQREKLENTNRRLDEINTNLNYSQKHLNGIKSVFYSIKSYISGKSDTPPPTGSQSSPDAGPSSSKLRETLDNIPPISKEERYSSHPSTALRGLEPVQSDSRRVDEKLNANLEEMTHVISRLKGLGSALGEEIDKQNHLLDTIHDKAEDADLKIGRQNKQMNKILNK